MDSERREEGASKISINTWKQLLEVNLRNGDCVAGFGAKIKTSASLNGIPDPNKWSQVALPIYEQRPVEYHSTNRENLDCNKKLKMDTITFAATFQLKLRTINWWMVTELVINSYGTQSKQI